MQTLILINPVAGLPRPDVPASDIPSAEWLSDAFADLLAEVPEEQSPADRTGPLSFLLLIATSSGSVLPVRSEPIGAVQGLAEAAAMAVEAGESGLVILETLSLASNEVVFRDLVPEPSLLPADPSGWTPAALVPFLLPTSLPQGWAHPALNHPAEVVPTQDPSVGKPSPKAVASLTHPTLIDEGPPKIERLALASLPATTGLVNDGPKLPSIPGFGLLDLSAIDTPLPDGATAARDRSDVPGYPEAGLLHFPGKVVLSSAGATMMEPAVLDFPASGSLQLPWNDVLVLSGSQTQGRADLWQAPSRLVIASIFAAQPANQIPPPAEVSRAVARVQTESDAGNAALQFPTPLGPVLVTSVATGAAVLWQASLVAEADQNLPADPASADVSAQADTQTSIPPFVFLRREGQVVSDLRLDGGYVSGMTVLAQPDTPDDEIEAGIPSALGPSPTNGGSVAATGHLAASVSLQDLPRLSAQLAGTLVHRADGQTEIALSPEELGHVRLSMQADAQNPERMVVMLTFDRPETLDLFRRHADQLADALREAGYSGADISFGRSGDENARDGSDPDRPAFTPHDTAKDTDGAPKHHRSAIAATGSLDLRL